MSALKNTARSAKSLFLLLLLALPASAHLFAQTAEENLPAESSPAAIVEPVEQPAADTVAPAASPSPLASPTAVTSGDEEVAAPAVAESSDVQLPNKVLRQMALAPEDPSFLYETRYIPGLKQESEFLGPQLEKEVIIERLEDDSQASKLSQYLPNTSQALVIGVTVLIFILYRLRIRKVQRSQRYR